MDMILTIFKSLGVDQTVFIQFATLIIIFFLVSNLLFSKLQEVLALREEKTTKLIEESAKKKGIFGLGKKIKIRRQKIAKGGK